MKNLLIEAMQDINSQIKQLDEDLDYIAMSELRRQRFYILSTYKYFLSRGHFTGSLEAVKSMPEISRNMEVSQ